MTNKEFAAILAYAKINNLNTTEAIDKYFEYLNMFHKQADNELQDLILTKCGGNFSYFDRPISELCNTELIDWYIAFKNGADLFCPRDMADLMIFKSEVPKRSEMFQDTIEYIDSVM